MGILFTICLVVVLVAFFLTDDAEDFFSVLQFVFWVGLCIAFFIIIFSEPKKGENQVQFEIGEDVKLPDGSFGRIEDVYFVVEDSLYQQNKLRNED